MSPSHWLNWIVYRCDFKLREISNSEWVHRLERGMDNLILGIPSNPFVRSRMDRGKVFGSEETVGLRESINNLFPRIPRYPLMDLLRNTHVLLALLLSFYSAYLVLIIGIWSVISPILPAILKILMGTLYTVLSLWILPQVFVSIFFPILNHEIDTVMDKLNLDSTERMIKINIHDVRDDDEYGQENWSLYLLLPRRSKLWRNVTTRSLRRQILSSSLLMDTDKDLIKILTYLINSNTVHINEVNLLDDSGNIRNQVRYVYIYDSKLGLYYVLDINSTVYTTYLKWMGIFHLLKDWNYRKYILGRRLYLSRFVLPSLYIYLGLNRIFLPKDNRSNFNRYHDQYGMVRMDTAPAFPALVPIINQTNGIVGKVFDKQRNLFSQKESKMRSSFVPNRLLLDYGILIIVMWFVMNLIFWLIDTNRDYENRNKDLAWRLEIKTMLANVIKFISFLIITCMMLLIWYAI